MVNVVISQPMFFPWVGFLEQIRLADVYVHYDDVQFSKGSFTNRVQIKTPDGFTWLTVPLFNLKLGQNISDVRVDTSVDWRRRHKALLGKHYEGAPFAHEMLDLVAGVFALPTDRLVEIAIASMQAVLEYFGIARSVKFIYSSNTSVAGKGSSRVLDIVRSLGGTTYITGHGARQYLQHETFEAEGIRVEYIDYRKVAYPQLHGLFNPHVSSLDLIANMGRAGVEKICSTTKYWQDFLTTDSRATLDA